MSRGEAGSARCKKGGPTRAPDECMTRADRVLPLITDDDPDQSLFTGDGRGVAEEGCTDMVTTPSATLLLHTHTYTHYPSRKKKKKNH